jgi:peptidoglycan DL-endopeptidase CwlO
VSAAVRRLSVALLALVVALVTLAASGKAAARRPATPPAPGPVVTGQHPLSQDAATPAPPPAPTTRQITVRPGATLWRLSHEYATTVRTLQDLNGLGTRTLIRAGQTLTVPPPATTAPAFARAQLGKPYVWGGTRTSRAALAPGDLVFTNGGHHVELYAGNAQVIYAPQPGERIRTGPLPPALAVVAYVHPG